MTKLELDTARWWGWLEAPARVAGWAASPILITNITPRKTGQGILSLEFVQPLHPGGAVTRSVELKMIQHEVDHLVGRYDDAGRMRIAVLCEATFDWMATYCVEHLRRRPVQAAQWFIGDHPLDEPTPQSHLERVFGVLPSHVLSGATRESFPANEPALPALRSGFTLNQTYSAFDSWLITRGFTPTAMEEKWFIYWADGTLTFRRSWTGYVVYEVEAVWRGEQLYLGAAVVNRDPEQYGETDDGYDRALLIYIIDAVLLGKEAAFPDKLSETDGNSALGAWSNVGAAAL